MTAEKNQASLGFQSKELRTVEHFFQKSTRSVCSCIPNSNSSTFRDEQADRVFCTPKYSHEAAQLVAPLTMVVWKSRFVVRTLRAGAPPEISLISLRTRSNRCSRIYRYARSGGYLVPNRCARVHFFCRAGCASRAADGKPGCAHEPQDLKHDSDHANPLSQEACGRLQYK